MTPDERERLAALVAAEIERTLEQGSHSPTATPWLPTPVRPEPPGQPGEPPVWSGAGQPLGDLVPVRHPAAPAHRGDLGESTAAIRAAAAGKGARIITTPSPSSGRARGVHSAASRRRAAGHIEVPIGVSRRHVHLSEAHVKAIFGVSTLDVHRVIKQPGQFAATQQVAVVGPKGTIEAVRVVGPPRGETQVELARSDAARLGIEPPLAASGTLESSLGGVTLVGPHGRVTLARGVIVAARHLHVSPVDAGRWGLSDGDRLDVRCGSGARAVTWHDVLVRAGTAHATEFHLDEDEARAADVETGDIARIVGWHESRPARRVLITEQELIARVRRGEALPDHAILTPGARDRARALGIDLA